MDGSIQVMELIILGTGAALVILMLRSVLGRKTGNERHRPSPIAQRERHEAGADEDNVTPLPTALNAEATDAGTIENHADTGSDLSQALTEIQLADRNFDPDGFLSGGKAAYEMIITAFAKGDKRALKPLLGTDVYKSFESEIEARGARGESIETTFIGIDTAKISGAALTDKIAEITVKFVSELISVTTNSDGAVIGGDPNQIFKITDVWTFARDTKASDPNWKLSATLAG